MPEPEPECRLQFTLGATADAMLSPLPTDGPTSKQGARADRRLLGAKVAHTSAIRRRRSNRTGRGRNPGREAAMV